MRSIHIGNDIELQEHALRTIYIIARMITEIQTSQVQLPVPHGIRELRRLRYQLSRYPWHDDYSLRLERTRRG